MIVDRLEQRETGDRVERSARLRWVGGEFRLRVTAPSDFVAPANDATAWMAVALLLAMHRHEDLYVDGEVSALFLSRLEEIQAIYASFDPELRRCRVRVAAEAPARERPEAVAGFFSRGADSMYTVTRERETPLSHLVFCDTMDPAHDEDTRAEERRLAGEAAGLIGLPLLHMSMNLRDPGARVIDFFDIHGAMLAMLAHSIAGGVGHAVFAAAASYSLLGPGGSHPVLDHHFSSASLRIEHDYPTLGRPGKVRHIVEERPELLPYLKVCQGRGGAGNTPRNCGRCRKCMWTMICLQAAGGLDRASGFPDELDLEAIGELRLEHYIQRVWWSEAIGSLGDSERDRAVRAAVEHVLRRSARPSLLDRARAYWEWLNGRRPTPDPAWSTSASGQLRSWTNSTIALMRDGKPYPYGIEFSLPQPRPVWSVGPVPDDWTPPPEPPADRVGLLRILDHADRRHRYAAASMPPVAGAERVGELGALLADGDIPLWVMEDGRVATDRYAPEPARAGVGKVLRWSLAPLTWRDIAPPRELLRSVALRPSLALRARTDGSRPDGEPVGYLGAEESDGRLPLWSAVHPVTGDQLLSTRAGDAGNLGYGEPVKLGYLEAVAPVSGRLGDGRPVIPWAARFGQRLP